MGGKTETTTRNRTDPSRWLMPHINTVLGGARSLYGAGPTASGSPFSRMQSRYGGMGGFGGILDGRFSGGGDAGQGIPEGGQPTYAEFSPTTERALQGYEDRAAAGSPILDAGAEQLMGTLRGDYLTPDSNPFLRQYGDALAGHVQDRVNAEFSKAGRYGSGRHAGTTAREIGNTLSGLYGGAYENERSRMAGAVPQSIPFANQDYRNLEAMLGAGQVRDTKAQQVIDDPYQRIMRYLSIIRGVPQGTEGYGKQTTTQTPGALDIINTAGNIASSVAMLSDPELKTNVRPVNEEEALSRLRQLPVSDYQYKDSAQQAFGLPEARTGPMADDYARTFGGDGRTIDVADALGNAIAAIKALDKRTQGMFGQRRAA